MESSGRLFGRLNPETFAPFRYRDFNVLWLVIFVRSVGLWMDMVARPVLIVELTGSALLLGAVLAAYRVPFLVLSPFLGVVIDRYPYRRVLMGAVFANVVSSGALFVLLLFDQVAGWHILLLSPLAGLSAAGFAPARRAMLPAIVGESNLRSATALSQTANSGMRIGGALLAGLLLVFADFTWIYALMMVFSLVAVSLMTLIRSREAPHEAAPDAGRSIIRQISGGARWALRTRWPLAVLLIAAALFIFLRPYDGVMLPLIVINELGEHKSWVGYLIAISGIGAVLGPVGLAALKEIRSPNILMIGLVIVAGLVLSLLAFAPHLALIAIGVFFAGACQSNMVSVANLALLAHAPKRLRGQALALMNLVIGSTLVGALIAGALADWLGPRFGLLTMGVCLLGAALLALSTPRVRWWLWRRQRYADVSAEDWLRGPDGDR